MFEPTPPLTRRQMLRTASCGFGSLALAGLCAEAAAADRQAENPLAARAPMFAPRAKRVIFIFMQGGPSQVDSFDPKPRLTRDDGKKVQIYNAREMKKKEERLMGPLWKFKRYGQSGRWVSELFPHMARHVDDFCLIRSMHTEGVAHGPATLFLHTGATALIRPSVGAWIGYGLGTANRNLPGFVTINPPMSKGGPRNYANAFLPAQYQGTAIGRAGAPPSQMKVRHITNERLSTARQRRRLDLLQGLNRRQVRQHTGAGAGGAGAAENELEAVIDSFELAHRMQTSAPGVTDISGESAATREMYGLDEEPTRAFGTQCLLARRLAEADVRYIQINYSDNSATPQWDQHSNMPAHEKHARATDKPVAALLADLKQRGLLEDTLVWWGGEFGRTPYAQGKDGRDHNPRGFSIWLAGGGVRAGHAHGQTDELGYEAAEGKVHMHDLHATILHLMGLDHTKLTYRHAGRDFRLTDVHGRIVRDIIA